MKVRSAQVGDAEALLALRCALWPERELHDHEGEIRRRVEARSRHETLLVEDPAGKVCGFLELTRDPGPPARVLLEAVFVAPGSRRQGAASRLLAAAERWAHGRGARALVSELDAAEEAAREALGWLGFGEPEQRLRLTRPVSAPLEVQRTAAPAADAVAQGVAPGEAEPLVIARPVRSPVFLVVNVALFAAAVASFLFSDIYARDVLRGVLLPMLDAVFVLYFLFLFLIVRYRRRADSSDRAGQLFRNEP